MFLPKPYNAEKKLNEIMTNSKIIYEQFLKDFDMLMEYENKVSGILFLEKYDNNLYYLQEIDGQENKGSEAADKKIDKAKDQTGAAATGNKNDEAKPDKKQTESATKMKEFFKGYLIKLIGFVKQSQANLLLFLQKKIHGVGKDTIERAKTCKRTEPLQKLDNAFKLKENVIVPVSEMVKFLTEHCNLILKALGSEPGFWKKYSSGAKVWILAKWNGIDIKDIKEYRENLKKPLKGYEEGMPLNEAVILAIENMEFEESGEFKKYQTEIGINMAKLKDEGLAKFDKLATVDMPEDKKAIVEDLKKLIQYNFAINTMLTNILRRNLVISMKIVFEAAKKVKEDNKEADKANDKKKEEEEKDKEK